jgi:sulfofructosephosphate aldolase
MTSAQSSEATTGPDLSVLARPSGGFAMLAVDQREAMRAMFADRQAAPVTDEQLTRFKLAAASILTPYASGVLLDKQFVFDQAVAAGAVDPGCGLIAAADHFIAGPDEFVADVEIDTGVVPDAVREQGAVAMKLLVIHRPDGDPGARIRMVEEFVGRCRAAGLISIIEPVSKAPRDGREWDWDDGVLAAARELGALGADLYKAEVPLRGLGEPSEIHRSCEAITEAVASPWVVLSSGVPHELFPDSVRIACAAGASGFLAGRAVWASVIGSEDVERDLRAISVPRLERLGAVVDEALGK